MNARGARLGLLTSSNFFVPQVNLSGSMARFVKPAAIRRYGLGQADTSPATPDVFPTPLPPMQPGYIQQTIQDGTVITSRITFPAATSSDTGSGTASGTPVAGGYTPSSTNASNCPFGTGQFAQLFCSQNFWLLVLGITAIGFVFVGGRRR